MPGYLYTSTPADLVTVRAALGLPRTANTIALLGDSRLVDQFSDSNNGTTTWPTFRAVRQINTNFFNVANALSGQRVKTVYNGARGGWRSDQYLARLSEAIASGASTLLIFGVINDFTQASTTGDTAATIFGRIKAAAETAILAGMRVIVCTEPGSSNLTSWANGQMRVGFNQRLREWAWLTDNVYVFDLAAVSDLPTSTSPTTRTGWTTDGTHFNALGGFNLGVAFAPLVQRIFAPIDQQPSSAFEAGNFASPIQQLVNNLFTTTSGGTTGANVTGTTPANWVSLASNATATISVIADPGGYGNAVQLACNFTAQGGYVQLKQDTTVGNYSVGDIVQAGGGIQVAAGSVSLSATSMAISGGGGALVTGPECLAQDINTGTAVVLPSVAMDLTMTTSPAAVVAAPSWMTHVTTITGAAAGSATVIIRRPWLRRRFAF